MRRESEPGVGWVLDMQMGALALLDATASVEMAYLRCGASYDRCSTGQGSMDATVVVGVG